LRNVDWKARARPGNESNRAVLGAHRPSFTALSPRAADRVQGAQVVHVSPHSDAYQLVDAGQRAPAFDCQGAPFGWPYPPINPGPFGYELEAWYVEPGAMPTALPAQQAAAAAIFGACCGGADACAAWKAAAAHAGGEPLDLCALDDVVCRGDGAVDALRLAGYGLECDAAALDWSAFASVRFLDLRYNRLSGSFDALAADLAAAMPALLELSVSYNEALGGDLGGAGGGLCALAATGLEAVQMGVTAVSGALPACLFAPGASLRHVYASRTGVSGALPPTFGAAAPTLVLQVAGAALTGPLPAVLPPALLKLNLTHNELTGGLPDIGAVAQLTVLDLMQNGFDGAVPESYAAHPALRWLDLDGNALTALPALWLAEAPAPPANGAPLWYVYLDNNAFAGAAFPAGLALYPNLTGLGLSRAGFAGPLSELPAGGFASLQELGAGGNALTGTVPDSWEGMGLFQDAGAAMGLRRLELQDNALSGVLPEWLADPVPNLVRNLSGNDFSNGCEPQFAALRACPAPPAEEGGGGGGLSAGAIFGICLVAILAVAAIVGAVVWRRRRAAAAASAGTLAGSAGSPLSSATFAGRGSRYERFEEAPTAAAQMHTELASRPGNTARESAVYDTLRL
jgi:hypothetical protein